MNGAAGATLGFLPKTPSSSAVWRAFSRRPTLSVRLNSSMHCAAFCSSSR
jgi:hypothetical protein